tara:strand:+ start:3551 stop:4213 length:663 start_codon:yes stop_codon:yes gene_type:complete
MVRLCPIVYDRNDPSTDFTCIIHKEAYKDALFLFGDNFEDRNKKYPGGNSARIRPLTFLTPPKAMGISTGWSTKEGGFQVLCENTKMVIRMCYETVFLILYENPHIQRVFFACDQKNMNSFGFSIFQPSFEVVNFLNKQLQSIPARARMNVAISATVISMMEDVIVKRRKYEKMTKTATNSLTYSLNFKAFDAKNSKKYNTPYIDKSYVDIFRNRKRVRE